ncbi:MAG: hypothetical protein ACKPEY_20215 [Planctomycetota bacterium]
MLTAQGRATSLAGDAEDEETEEQLGQGRAGAWAIGANGEAGRCRDETGAVREA